MPPKILRRERYFNPVYIISSLDQEISFLHTKNKPVLHETKKNKIPFVTSNPLDFPEAVLYACNMRSKYFKGKKRVQIKFCTRMQLPGNVHHPIRLWALIWGVGPHKTGWLRNNSVIFYMLCSYRKFKFTTEKTSKKLSGFVHLAKDHGFFEFFYATPSFGRPFVDIFNTKVFRFRYKAKLYKKNINIIFRRILKIIKK